MFSRPIYFHTFIFSYVLNAMNFPFWITLTLFHIFWYIVFLLKYFLNNFAVWVFVIFMIQSFFLPKFLSCSKFTEMWWQKMISIGKFYFSNNFEVIYTVQRVKTGFWSVPWKGPGDTQVMRSNGYRWTYACHVGSVSKVIPGTVNSKYIGWSG